MGKAQKSLHKTSALALLPGYFHSDRGKGRIWYVMCTAEIIRKIILCSYLKYALNQPLLRSSFWCSVSVPDGSWGDIYLLFSLHSPPMTGISQANSVWLGSTQDTATGMCCVKKQNTWALEYNNPFPPSPHPPQSDSCRCGQQNKQRLCWCSWFHKQGFVVRSHWLRTLGIVAKQLCTYMLHCFCWGV